MELVSPLKEASEKCLRMCYMKVIVRNLPCVNQKVGRHQTPNMPAPSSWISQPPSGSKSFFFFFFLFISHPVCFITATQTLVSKRNRAKPSVFLFLPTLNVVLFFGLLWGETAQHCTWFALIPGELSQCLLQSEQQLPGLAEVLLRSSCLCSCPPGPHCPSPSQAHISPSGQSCSPLLLSISSCRKPLRASLHSEPPNLCLQEWPEVVAFALQSIPSGPQALDVGRHPSKHETLAQFFFFFLLYLLFLFSHPFVSIECSVWCSVQRQKQSTLSLQTAVWSMWLVATTCNGPVCVGVSFFLAVTSQKSFFIFIFIFLVCARIGSHYILYNLWWDYYLLLSNYINYRLFPCAKTFKKQNKTPSHECIFTNSPSQLPLLQGSWVRGRCLFR